MPSADKRVIVAFDSTDVREALALGRKLRGLIRYAKIGSILFSAAGPEAIARFKALGFEIFLDLKFHDIPSTVEKSCRAAAQHGLWMLTVHASGPEGMLEAAVVGAREGARTRGLARPLVVGVTVLTSVGDGKAVSTRALSLAQQAKRAGLDGVVTSAHEAPLIRRRAGRSFVLVCPGIRPAGVERADQRRVVTPREAIARGADFLVVGRPITGADDPRGATQRILDEIR